MGTTTPTSVDEYVASQPEAVRGVLERVRGAIRRAVPGAEEVISYKMPTYRLHGITVLHFAGWKQHYALYPATDSAVAEFKSEFAPDQIRNATFRFSLTKPVPVDLIGRIAKFRVQEVAQGRGVKAP